MANVMHKFLVYLSIYFCLTYFGLSLSPSSEAPASEDGHKESPKHVRQK
jgi:preprotein translocase subunit SecG